MKGLLLAAPQSGSGKTTLACALLRVLQKKGYSPCAFKCGPDYLDPTFHRAVLGVESHNLDLFLSQPEEVRSLFSRSVAGHDLALVEGAMGLYDGVGGSTDQASAWQVADTLDLPIFLVVRPKGASLTLAAQIKGLMGFRANSHISGLFLNDCSETLYRSLAPMLERETGLPVLGFLPHSEDARFESRHLGLLAAQEICDLDQRVDRLADTLLHTADLVRLLSLCSIPEIPAAPPVHTREYPVKIAVAYDKAFSFIYAETIENFKALGGELIFFSPISDPCIPQGADALYLPGGYPELCAKALSENRSMRESILSAVRGGLPTVAECGGFLYLGHTFQTEDGRIWPMVGVLTGESHPTGRLVRFGYATLTPSEDSLLFRAGEKVPCHEFHYWDSTDNGEDLLAVKPATGRSWHCGHLSPTLYAGFPHLYFTQTLARRFLSAAWDHHQGEHHAAF